MHDACMYVYTVLHGAWYYDVLYINRYRYGTKSYRTSFLLPTSLQAPYKTVFFYFSYLSSKLTSDDIVIIVVYIYMYE
jgi:hypothetical protein